MRNLDSLFRLHMSWLDQGLAFNPQNVQPIVERRSILGRLPLNIAEPLLNLVNRGANSRLVDPFTPDRAHFGGS